MAKVVKIYRGTSRIRVKIDFKTDVQTILREYVTRPKLTSYIWNPRFKRDDVNRRYFRFDVSTSELIMPVNALNMVVEALEANGYEVNVEDEELVKPRKIFIRMKKEFVPRENQKPIIEYIASHDIARKGVAAATGFGKTVVSTAGAVAYGYATIIVVSGLLDQWRDSILQFTTADSSDIYLIQGINSIKKLSTTMRKPSFFIISIETLRAWLDYGDPYKAVEAISYPLFLNKFGIGTKINDESHLQFHQNVIIDTYTNIEHLVYMTATFAVSDQSTKPIFNLVYPPEMRYGEDTAEAYVDVVDVHYIGRVPERKVSRQRGYSHLEYERYLLKRPTLLSQHFGFLERLIFTYYLNIRNPGERMMIYFSMKETIHAFLDYLKRDLPRETMHEYVSGSPDSVLRKYNIIATTTQRAGVGTDVKQLRTVINTISMKSEPLVRQLRGRLRKLPNGVTPLFIEITDETINAQRIHSFVRRRFHRKQARSYTVINLQY